MVSDLFFDSFFDLFLTFAEGDPNKTQLAASKKCKSPSSSMVADAEASVLATFEFLNESRDARADDDVDDDDDDDELVDNVDAGGGRMAFSEGGPFTIDSETEEA